MKVVSLRAENFKRIQVVEITPGPDQAVIEVKGKNGAGKSSVLDAIWCALGGESALPAKPIREGAERAEIRLDLDDLVVLRTFTGTGTYLKVANKEGARFSSPQAVLDKLLGNFTFDPLEFMRLKPSAQRELLLTLSGCADQLARIGAAFDEAYAGRTDLNREVKRLDGVLDSIKREGKEIPVSRPIAVDTSAELAERRRRETANQARAESVSAVGELQETLEGCRDEVTEQKNKIADLERQLAEAKQKLAGCENRVITAQAKYQEGVANLNGMPTATFEDIDLKIASASTLAAQIALFDRWENATRAKAETAKQAQQLTDKLAEFEKQKLNLIANSKLPIDGIAFTTDGVLLGNIPLAQCSSAEQLRVSLAIAMAANPKLRVIRIADGSLLDAEGMKLVQKMALTNGYQVWIERVSDDTGETGIIIEEGFVRETPIVAPE